MTSATKYGLYFFSVFVVSSLAMWCLLYQNIHPVNDAIGYWTNFDDPDFEAAIITPEGIDLYYGRGTNRKHLEKAGHWTDHAFFAKPGPDESEKVVARQLENEDLTLDMSIFNPRDSRMLNCVKYMRGPNEIYPLPTSRQGFVVTYPPPKGLIHPGILEADLRTLPYEGTVITATASALERGDAWNDRIGPSVHHYRSTQPNVPELQVTVERGRVTQVTGGYEDSNAAAYFPSTSRPEPPSSKTDNEREDKGWLGYLYDFFFGR